KVLLEHGELDEADRALDSVWQIIDTIEHWPVLAHLRATIEIARGDAEAGLERLQALRRRRGARMPRSQTRLLDLTESALALAAGDLTTARGFTSRAGDSALVALGVLRVELFAGQEERVLRVLGGISPDGPEARAHLAVLEALAWSRLDRGNDAAVAARRARTIADTYGLMTPFLLMSAAEREMFQVVVPSNAPALSQVQAPRLTQRELVILQELVDTANVNDIAQRLHVSANTVKTQRRTLYRKLGAA